MSNKKAARTLIAQRREELGLTQVEMAREVDVDPRTLQRWEEKGRPGHMPIWKVAQVCKAYKWTIEEMASACYPDKAAKPEQSDETSPSHYKANGGMA